MAEGGFVPTAAQWDELKAEIAVHVARYKDLRNITADPFVQEAHNVVEALHGRMLRAESGEAAPDAAG